MSKSAAVWNPSYTIAPKVARRLMEIESIRATIERKPIGLIVKAQLAHKARLRSTHYSTRIEGNRLTQDEAEKVIRKEGIDIKGRERDVREVCNYWDALIRVEQWAESKRVVDENMIRRLHAMVEHSPRAKPTAYRDGQNVIRDSGSGAIVYMPPEAHDVPELIAGMIRWIEQAPKKDIPVPLIAGLAHYQFVTIHPYYDGNGRTARLLANFLLYRGGYGLGGLLSPEERYAVNLSEYYKALAVHPHHNYYEGRAHADLTAWIEYFTETLACTFESIRNETAKIALESIPDEPELLRKLDRRGHIVLARFAEKEHITTPQVAAELGLSDRMARLLLKDWVGQGWLMMADSSRRKRAYILSAIYRQLIGNLSAI